MVGGRAAVLFVVLLLLPHAVAKHRGPEGQYGPETPVGLVDALPAPDGAFDLTNMSIAGWGSTTAIGLPAEGVIYRYERTNDGHFGIAQRFTAPLGVTGGFGRAMAFSSAGLATTAERGDSRTLYVYPWGWESMDPIPESIHVDDAEGLDFGHVVSAAAPRADLLEARVIVVGAPSLGDRPGAVYAWRASDDGWVLEARMTSGSPTFGSSLALAGEVLFVGDPGVGEVRIYEPEAGTWVANGTIESDLPGFGRQVSYDWLRLLVAANGTTMLYTRPDVETAWSPAYEVRPQDPDPSFGTSIVMQWGTAYVGAPGDGPTGAVYRYLVRADVGVFAERTVGPAAPGSFATKLVTGMDVEALFVPEAVGCYWGYEIGPTSEPPDTWEDPCPYVEAPSNATEGNTTDGDAPARNVTDGTIDGAATGGPNVAPHAQDGSKGPADGMATDAGNELGEAAPSRPASFPVPAPPVVLVIMALAVFVLRRR